MEIDTSKIEYYLEEIITASNHAGDAIMKVYEREDLGIKSKADESPLTLADLAANEILCETLVRIAPEIPIISEEYNNIDFEDRKGWEYCWVVDPLDGTKEFIKRNGEFTTNVALIRRGVPVLGVIYAPALDEMYWGAEGLGAHFEQDGEVMEINAANYELTDVGLKLVCSRSHLNEETQAFVDQFDSPELVASGSSLKFMKIARGEAHIYPRLAPTMEWDTAAAQAILTEAGGQVLHADSQKPLIYNKENLLNPHFIARGRQL